MFISYLLCILLPFCYAGIFSVDYGNYRFLKDGRPFRYIAAEIHYFRIHPDLWEDRLQKVRAAGLNAVSVYMPWNLHEPTQGNFDFSGGLNFTRFFTLAQQYNLNVLLRPGPYICAEFEFGGLPWWLLNYNRIGIRSSETNYLNSVQSYYATLLPLLKPLLYKNGGPILMLQLENEYGNFGCDKAYLNSLRDLFWSYLGNDTVLYTTDSAIERSVSCGAVDGTLTTIDVGNYGNNANIAQIKAAFEMQQNLSAIKGGPNVCSEFYPGWIMQWGEKHYSHPTPEEFVAKLAYMYSLNASVSIYMFHGGTNFGFLNGAEVITSYEYNAPIYENGDITDLYLAIRNFTQNLPDWDNKPLEIPNNNTVLNYGQVTFTRLGSNLISTLTQIQEACQSSNDSDPLTFEHLNHPYGYVLYTNTLTNKGVNLSAEWIKDYGYVYLNNVYQGMLNRKCNTSINLSGAQNGDILRILVEEYGRANTGGIDPKGLHGGVLLDGKPLLNWYACGINLTKEAIDSLTTNYLRYHENDVVIPEKATSQAGVYVGTFNANQIEDTFFDSTGWSKGQLFVNGYNIGRYWPTAGPQITLYVPKPYIQSKNTVVLIELLGTQQNSAQFINQTKWLIPY